MQNTQTCHSKYYCYRCKRGSIHLVCGNVVLMFTPDEFASMAETVSEMQRQIGEEVNISTTQDYSDSAVM